MQKDLLSVKETLEYLNIKSKVTLAKITKKANLTKVKIGDLKIFYKISELQEYINKQ